MPDILNQYDYKRFEELLETMIEEESKEENYFDSNVSELRVTLKLIKERRLNLIKT